MLIGLAAKNAILIVEFAKMEYDAGKPLIDAALNAAKLRFRPILMTAFAFILGVVPLLTASGAGAESRKVMGMTVFSGMLDRDDPRRAARFRCCTSLVEKMIGVKQHAPAAARRRRRRTHWPRNTGRGGTEMSIRRAQSVASWHRRVRGARWMRRRAELRQAHASDAARSTASSKRPRRRSRWPTCAWFQVFDDPTLQALIRDAIANNLDLRVALAHVEEARARAGIAKWYLYPQVDGDGLLRRARGVHDGKNDDTTHQSGNYGFQLSWELDLFGRLRRGQESAIALALASEQGRRGVLVTLVGDVATNYFLLRELDLQIADRAGKPSASTTKRSPISGIVWTAACRIVWSSTAFWRFASRPPSRSRKSSARSLLSRI